MSMMAQRDTSHSGHGAPAAGGQSRRWLWERKVLRWCQVVASSWSTIRYSRLYGAMTMGYRFRTRVPARDRKAGTPSFYLDTPQKAIVTIEKFTQ